MFYIVSMTDIVRIPPSRLTNSLRNTAIGILKEKYESMISPEVGYVIMITDANPSSIGKLVAGDGATYHKVTFKALAFYPKLQEIIEGEVVEITDFGAFVRIGPTDALLHLSQITDDYLKSDVKQGVIVANQTARSLKIGSKIRARITAVSLGKGAGMGKARGDVLQGTLATHDGKFGPGHFVWFPEGQVMEHGATPEGDVVVLRLSVAPDALELAMFSDMADARKVGARVGVRDLDHEPVTPGSL